MPSRLRAIAIILPVALAAAGCGQFDKSLFADGRAGIATPRSFMDKGYEEVDIIAALTDGKSQTNISDKTTDVEASKQLQAAYTQFYSLNTTNRDGAERRNQIQDELFRASDQRCNYYKAYLYHLQSTQRTFFGGLSTALGGLGAIFTSASTARALSGAAGITSGVGAEAMEAQFASLTIQVLIEGIEKQRKDVYEAARTQRFKTDSTTKTDRLASLREYTVEHAILDAVRYHGACTITEGLRAAANSIQTIRHPGPEMMQFAVQQSMRLRATLDGKSVPETWSLGYGAFGGAGGAGTAAFGGSDGIDIVPDVSAAIRISALTRRAKALGDAATAQLKIVKSELPEKIEVKIGDKSLSYTADTLATAIGALSELFNKKLAAQIDGTIQLVGSTTKRRKIEEFAGALKSKNILVLAATDDVARRVAFAEFRLEYEKFYSEIGQHFDKLIAELEADLTALEEVLAAATKNYAQRDKPEFAKNLQTSANLVAKYSPPNDTK